LPEGPLGRRGRWTAPGRVAARILQRLGHSAVARTTARGPRPSPSSASAPITESARSLRSRDSVILAELVITGFRLRIPGCDSPGS